MSRQGNSNTLRRFRVSCRSTQSCRAFERRILSKPRVDGENFSRGLAFLKNEPEKYSHLEMCIQRLPWIPQEMRKPLLDAIADHDLWEKVEKSLAADFCKGETGCFAIGRDDFALACSTLGPAADIPNRLFAPSLGSIHFPRSCCGFSLHTLLSRVEELGGTVSYHTWLGPRTGKMLSLLAKDTQLHDRFRSVVAFLKTHNIPHDIRLVMQSLVDPDGKIFGNDIDGVY